MGKFQDRQSKNVQSDTALTSSTFIFGIHNESESHIGTSCNHEHSKINRPYARGYQSFSEILKMTLKIEPKVTQTYLSLNLERWLKNLFKENKILRHSW